MKIAVALSGGVDSSVTAMLLQDRGHEVVGVTFDLGEHGKDAIEDAAKVCEFLGIEHVVVDYRKLFEDVVVADFLDCYLSGKTPNPCVVCNKHIKFGQFITDAMALGCDKVATGHYARVLERDGKSYIARSTDLKKDQSYALHRLSPAQIEKVMLPLDGMTKAELRVLAAERGLPVAHRPDSQDICFIPDGSHGAFIEAHRDTANSLGSFVDKEGRSIASHKGIYHYTIGQRKGLGISLGQYAYVQSIDGASNAVTLTTDEADLFSHDVWITMPEGADVEAIFNSNGLSAKLRYAHKAAEVSAVAVEGDCVKVTFKEAQRAATPGQSLVFYDGDYVLGGGTILR